MTIVELARRVKTLENEVAELKSSNGPRQRWWVDAAGRFVDDPVFDEIIQLGRAYRKSLRPRRRIRAKSS